jgi:type II secretory pathway pseudopilin PulG
MLVGQGQLLVLIVILVVGMIFGVAVAWWIAGSRKSNAPSPEEESLAQLRRQYLEQASLWRERTSGKLGLRVGEQVIEDPKQLKDAQIKALQAIAKEWCAWLGMPAAAPVREPQVPPAPALITPPPAASAAIISEPASRTAGVAVSVTASTQPQVVPNKPKSIVEQIDDILQAKLADSPARSKGIRLAEDPVHGVVVWIGIEHFNGVDMVSDPEVKALLRAAAAEWEQTAALPGQKK